MVNLGPAFSGDQSDIYGRTLTWDVNILATGGPLIAPDHFSLIEIRGRNGQTLVYRASVNPPVGEWAQVGGTIQAGEMRLPNGTLASEQQIRAVLADVQHTAARVEHVWGGFGVEQIAVDNFRLE